MRSLDEVLVDLKKAEKEFADKLEEFEAKQKAYKEVLTEADTFEAISGDAYSESNVTATFADLLKSDAESENEMV